MIFNKKNNKTIRKQKLRKLNFLAGSVFSILLGASAAVQAAETRIRLLHSNFDPLITDPDTSTPVRLLSNQEDSDQTAGLYIVQFNHSPLPADQQSLKDLGVKIYSPLADHALIVLMDGVTRRTVENLAVVRWVGSYHAAYKLEAGLDTLSDNVVSIQASQPIRFSIMLFESGSTIQQIVADRIEQLGGQIDLLTEHRRMEATFSPLVVEEIAQMPEVLFIDRWTPAEDDMDLVRDISGATFLETEEGYRGQGVRGEVLDDGIRTSHQDFQSNPPLIHGSNDSDNDHGTTTYGIVFGSGAGNQKAQGLLPDAEQPIFSSRYRVSDHYAHVEELVNPNGDYRGVFQSRSWGSGLTTRYTTISAEMDQIIFDHDLLITQSQSNEGNKNSRPQAWAKNIVAVGGILGRNTATRSDDRWGRSASIGPAHDGRIKPDISHFYDAIETTGHLSNKAYISFGGTSGSTPIVAGYFGVMFQMWADGVFSGGPGMNRDVFDSRPHASTAKALIINSAFQYQFSGRNHDKTRVHQGWGFPDVQNLYQEAKANGWKLPILIDETKVLDSAQTHQYSLVINAAANSPLKATMVYSDPPGLPSSSVQRINDLTLKVTSPSGVVYWGNNGLLKGNWSTPGGNPNTIDTVENVFVETPEPGTWDIEIQGNEIVKDSHVETPNIDADYALVVTGGTASTSSNLPPVSNAGPNQTVDEGTTVTLVGSGSDPDGSVVAYRWTQTSGLVIVLTNSNSATAEFTAPNVAANTVLNFNLEVTDNGGLTHSDPVAVTVNNTGGGNLPPVSDAGPDQTVDEGAIVSLDGSGSIDPDGSVVDYKWVQLSGPSVVISNPSSVTASFTAPNVTKDTVLRIRLRVKDDSGIIDRNAVNITVKDTPVSNGVDLVINKLTVKGSPFRVGKRLMPKAVVQNGGSANAEKNKMRFVISTDPVIDANDLSLGKLKTVFKLGSGKSRMVRGSFRIPTTVVPGTYYLGAMVDDSNVVVESDETNNTASVQIIIEKRKTGGGDDDGGLTESNGVDVSVNNIIVDNLPPVSNAGPDKAVTEGATVTLDGNGSTDPDGSVVAYKWIQLSGPVVAISNQKSVTASFTAPDVTVNTALRFRLRVTDNRGTIDRNAVNIIVKDSITGVNFPPEADAGRNRGVDEGEIFTLRGSATDLDGSVVSYQWTQIFGSVVVLSDPNSATTSFTAPDVGKDRDLRFRLEVTDDEGAIDRDRITILVIDTGVGNNIPPISNAGPDQTVDEGATVILNGNDSFDPDGSIVLYKWRQLFGPEVVLTDPSTATASFTTTDVTEDTVYRFRLIVQDDVGRTAVNGVSIIVKDPTAGINLPPVSNAGFDQKVYEGTLVNLIGRGTDPDGSIIDNKWIQLSGPLVDIIHLSSRRHVASASFIAPDVEKDTVFKIRLRVTDNGGKFDRNAVNITVIDKPEGSIPPPKALGSNQLVDEGSTVTLSSSVTVGAPGVSIVDYNWIQYEGPNVVLTNSNSPTPSFIAPEFAPGKFLLFALTITDSGGRTAMSGHNIVIKDPNEPTTVQN